VFGIFTSRSMRERGKYQIQCMKSRSSTGVGMKIDLEYNIETMRITDEDPEGEDRKQQTPSAIMDKIKVTSQIGSTNEIVHNTIETIENKIVPDVQSAKLKALLNSLKK